MVAYVRRLAAFLMVCAVAMAAEPPPPVPGAEVARGLTAVLGIDDVEWLVSLHADGQRPLHVLLPSAADVSTLRGTLLERGLLGAITVEHWHQADVLPYSSGLLRACVGDTRVVSVPAAEMKRVTAPYGTVSAFGRAGWQHTTLGLAEGQGEWPQPFADAGRSRHSTDREVGQPAYVKWADGPHYGQTLVAAADGMIIGIDLRLNNRYPRGPKAAGRWVVARDAANGLFLWRKEVREASWNRHKLHNDWFNGSNVGLLQEMVSIGHQRVWVAAEVAHNGKRHGGVLVLDPASGETIGQLVVEGRATRTLLTDDVVLVPSHLSLTAFDPQSLEQQWSLSGYPYDLVAINAENLAVFLDTEVEPYALVGVNLSDGTERWRQSLADEWNPEFDVKPSGRRLEKGGTTTRAQVRIVMADDDLVLLRHEAGRESYLRALKPADGTELWRYAHQPIEVKQYHNQKELVDKSIPPPPQILRQGPTIFYSIGAARFALDVATGTLKGHTSLRGINEACQWAVSTPRLVAFKDNVWSDAEFNPIILLEAAFNGGQPPPQHSTVGNSACGWHVIPAYGSTYFSTKDCSCSSTGNGVRSGISADQIPAQLLQDGAGHVVTSGDGRPGTAQQGGWNQLGGSAARHFSSSTALRLPLTERWSVRVPLVAEDRRVEFEHVSGRASQAVTDGQQVYVGDVAAGALYALSITDGSTQWIASAGGALTGAPVVAGGLTLAAATDGRVHAWSTTDGRQVWQARVGQSERRIARFGRISAAECAGPLLVHGDQVLTMVGPGIRTAEGMYTHALDLTTGATRWREREDWPQEILSYRDGVVVSAMTLGTKKWFGYRPRGVSRQIADGSSHDVPRERHQVFPSDIVRSAFIDRSFNAGPHGAGHFILSQSGSNLAFTDQFGRRVALLNESDFKPEMINGQWANAKQLFEEQARWTVDIPQGQMVVALVMAGDHVVVGTNLAQHWAGRHRTHSFASTGPGKLLIYSIASGELVASQDLKEPLVYQGISVGDKGAWVVGRSGLVTAFAVQ